MSVKTMLTSHGVHSPFCPEQLRLWMCRPACGAAGGVWGVSRGVSKRGVAVQGRGSCSPTMAPLTSLQSLHGKKAPSSNRPWLLTTLCRYRCALAYLF